MRVVPAFTVEVDTGTLAVHDLTPGATRPDVPVVLALLLVTLVSFLALPLVTLVGFLALDLVAIGSLLIALLARRHWSLKSSLISPTGWSWRPIPTRAMSRKRC